LSKKPGAVGQISPKDFIKDFVFDNKLMMPIITLLYGRFDAFAKRRQCRIVFNR
jgi:hypothetical protein